MLQSSDGYCALLTVVTARAAEPNSPQNDNHGCERRLQQRSIVERKTHLKPVPETKRRSIQILGFQASIVLQKREIPVKPMRTEVRHFTGKALHGPPGDETTCGGQVDEPALESASALNDFTGYMRQQTHRNAVADPSDMFMNANSTKHAWEARQRRLMKELETRRTVTRIEAIGSPLLVQMVKNLGACPRNAIP